MIEKYCGARIPDPEGKSDSSEGENVFWLELKNTAEMFAGPPLAPSSIVWRYDHFDFSRALEIVWVLVGAIDAYLSDRKPWALAEEPITRGRLDAVLYAAAEALRFVTVMAHPVLPESTNRLWKQLGQTSALGDQRIDALKWGQLKPGTIVSKGETLFPRVEKTQAIERMEAMEQDPNKSAAAPAASGEVAPASQPPVGAPAPAAAAPAAPAVTAKIGIEDFAKVELRVGQIKTAERVPKADKLLMLQVDIGDETRQIVAGIATAYEIEKLIGRKVIVVTNLAPRKLRGVESNGMIVAASAGPDGAPVLAGFLEDVPVGARLK
jgi:methionyl-tRNA synthetase